MVGHDLKVNIPKLLAFRDQYFILYRVGKLKICLRTGFIFLNTQVSYTVYTKLYCRLQFITVFLLKTYETCLTFLKLISGD